MRFYILSMLGLLLCFTTQAQQTAILEGVVVETDARGNISPVEGAIVFWKGSTAVKSTDSNGVFKIPFIGNSNYLIVMATGYASDTILVAGSNKLRILMISKGELQETVISYERKSSEISFIDPWKTTIMNEKELFKAACCNLSESFETNPSVDVAYTDALSGAKQIQMLGLAGQYTQVSIEQVPGIRGVASNAGLAYVPGAWINAIQVSKGMGSVVNGFESVSGQINVELHKSDVKEKAMFNAYAGAGGRYEVNAVVANKINEKFSQSILLHANTTIARMDRNEDGYLDNPLGNQYNLMYRFKYDNKKGFLVQGAVQGLQDK
ncbi:MAG: TonB-dependent receptor, partial [Bacteroidetes bacterium]|nr:TonB-dependent receptor [Bacteroidota bacterium]